VVRGIEALCDRRERPLPDLDIDARLVEQVERPAGRVTRRDEHGPVRLIDVAHGYGPWQAGPPTGRGDPGDPALEDELVADLVRQRARCQDLPSVWVDGA
jgi:hypothetical protein